MPKSRKRRTRKPPNRRAGRPTNPRTPHPLERLWPWVDVMLETDEAEARGDAAGVLELMGRRPLGPDGELFWRPWRVRRLMQIADLGPDLPRWAVSRWVLSQAHQSLDPSRHVSAVRAMEAAVALRGGIDHLPGANDHEKRAGVVDRDWVYRQLLLHEEGALDHFVRHVASPDLLVGACHLEEWEAAPMGGYRFLSGTPSTITWEVLGSDEPLVVPNIGSAAVLVPGEYAIGRTGPTDEGTMFQSVPLRVPEEVARRTARDPDTWIDALSEAAAADPDGVRTTPYDDSLLTDVPDPLWRCSLLVVTAEPVPRAEAVPAFLARAALRLARRTLADPSFATVDPVDPWSCLGAAVLDPMVADALTSGAFVPDHGLLRDLSAVLAEPAATACRRIADGRRRAA